MDKDVRIAELDAESAWLRRRLGEVEKLLARALDEICRQQDRPLFAYPVQAITQLPAGQPVPLLA